MSHRFFLENPPSGEQAELTGPEAQHVLRVMRSRVGDELTLFAGDGWEHRGQIVATGKQRVTLRITESREVDRESRRLLTLAVAPPKGERQRWLVEKAVELGVSALIPLITERGVVRPQPASLERWRRQVVEASKQCGRNRLMTVLPALSVPDLDRQTAGATRILADPRADSSSLRSFELSAPSEIVAAVGPEGGWSGPELQQFRDGGWTGVSLGPRILRIETAALQLAALLAAPGSRPPAPAEEPRI